LDPESAILHKEFTLCQDPFDRFCPKVTGHVQEGSFWWMRQVIGEAFPSV